MPALFFIDFTDSAHYNVERCTERNAAMERPPSSIELFKRYHARYPRIQMSAFKLGEITEAGRLYLMPTRDGVDLIERHRLAELKYPYVDIFKAGIRSRTDFKPEKGTTPQLQQQEALWKKISEEYFAGRQFSMHLGELPPWYQIPIGKQPMFPVQFRVWRAMRGLVLRRRFSEPIMYMHWSAFIPPGTDEHDAIRASLDVSHEADKKPSQRNAAEIQRRIGILREMIARISA